MNERMKNNRPLFIVGAPRSGTTLLQYMIRSHPKISLPTGESHFIIPLHRKSSEFGDLGNIENIRKVLVFMYGKSRDFLETDLHGMKFDIDSLVSKLHEKGCNTVPAIISEIFKINAGGEGKERWGDKTPYYVLHMKTILEMFPDAQFIHLIRDGRDCALSMFNRKYDFDVYNVYHAAKYWQQYVEAGQQAGRELGPTVYFELRYEDILADPASEMKRLCVFLGEAYSDSLVDFKKSSEPGKTPLLQKDIKKDNSGKWRQDFTVWQIRVFESAAGETLVKNGYTLLTNAVPLSLPLRAYWRAHNGLLTWYNRRVIQQHKSL